MSEKCPADLGRRVVDAIGSRIIAALIYPAVLVMVRDDRRQVQR